MSCLCQCYDFKPFFLVLYLLNGFEVQRKIIDGLLSVMGCCKVCMFLWEEHIGENSTSNLDNDDKRVAHIYMDLPGFDANFFTYWRLLSIS